MAGYWELGARRRRITAVAFFVIAERLLTATGIKALPPALLGMLALFAILLALEKCGLADSAYAFLEPGYRFLVKWSAIFFLPALMKIPLVEEKIGFSVMIRLITLLVLGFLGQLLFVAAVASSFPVESMQMEEGKPRDIVPYPRSGRPFQRRWIKVYIVVMLVSVASSLLGMKEAAEGVFLVATSLCLFVLSQSIPGRAKLLLHPITATLLGSWAAAACWAFQAGPDTTFKDVLQHFANGAGVYLSMFLSPLVVALALLLFEKRRLLTQNFIPMVTTALLAAASGLFGTALLARALRLPQSLALASLGRCLTAPLSLAVSASIGAQPALAIPLVVITGLLGAAFASPLLAMLRLRSARARGLAVGASSHVLGTVSLAQGDEEAFPYAAVGFVLVGGLSVLLVAVPCVQHMLLLVLGTVSS